MKIKENKKEYYKRNKEQLKKYQKEYQESNKDKLKEQKKRKARELGFESRTKKQRYDRWRKRNNVSTSIKDKDYLNNIQYWIENVDN